MLQNPCPFTLLQVASSPSSLNLFAHSAHSHTILKLPWGAWHKHKHTRGQERQQAQDPGGLGMVLFFSDGLVLSTGFLEKERPDLAFAGFHGVWLSDKNPPAMQDTREKWVRSLGREDPLEEEMATQPVFLLGKIPWTEEPGGLPSIGLQRVRHH